MKSRLYLLILVFISLFIIVGVVHAGEFKWARAKFHIEEENLTGMSYDDDSIDVRSGMWNIAMSGDQHMLSKIEELVNLKVNKKVFVVDFKDIDELCKYPFIFMHASGTLKLSDKEKDNLREYIKRGGFIFADDCCFKCWEKNETIPTPGYGSGWRYSSETFFNSVKDTVEKELFPGKKMVKLPNDHAIYNCHFSFKEGLPYVQGGEHGGYGFYDENERLRIFLSSHDIHCGWFFEEYHTNKEKNLECFKMAINIILYTLSH